MSDEIRNLVLQLRAWSEPIASGYEVPAAARTLHAAADALEAMAGEVERLTINGIHSCWEECPRLPCVQGREIRALTAERDRLAGEVAIVRSARDMHHANYELMKAHNKELFGKLSDAETERDRLKAALQDCIDAYDFVIVDEYDRGWSSVSDAIHAARKALGGDAS